MISVYAEDNTTVIGHIVAGKFEPILQATSPAPTGDELDDLVLDAATTFVTFPRLQGHVHYSLRVSDGRYPEDLLKELTLWIEQGDLRSPQQVNGALSRFCDYQERLVALGVEDTKWELSTFNVKKLRWYFHTPDAKPLPSKSEIIAEREKSTRDYEQRQRKAAKDTREMDRIVEQETRISDLLTTIAKKLWSLDDIDLEVSTPRLRFNRNQRKAFQRFQKQAIRQLVEAGKNDAEIIQEMQTMYELTVSTKSGKEWGSSIPETLKEGESREFVEPVGAMTRYMQVCEEKLSTHDVSISLCPDGRMAITVRPKESEEL
jgi:hypothetical protein